MFFFPYSLSVNETDDILDQGDYVASREDAVRLYSLFCCLSWCQKKEKRHHSSLQQYDVDLMNPTADDPVPTTGYNSRSFPNCLLTIFTTQQE